MENLKVVFFNSSNWWRKKKKVITKNSKFSLSISMHQKNEPNNVKAHGKLPPHHSFYSSFQPTSKNLTKYQKLKKKISFWVGQESISIYIKIKRKGRKIIRIIKKNLTVNQMILVLICNCCHTSDRNITYYRIKVFIQVIN